jgi:hypothetical protein
MMLNKSQLKFGIFHALPRGAIYLLSITLIGCVSTMPTSPQELFNMTLNAIPESTQFDRKETLALLEFCVNLDSQDDLHPVATPKKPVAKLSASETPFRAIYKMREDRIDQWKTISSSMDSRVRVAQDKLVKDPRNDVTYNPDENGFGPFSSAWTLWHKKDSDTWALVFRGTVFSKAPSVNEDVLVTTVAAKNGLEMKGQTLPITFAELPRAEVHEGFAYGTLSMLFDKNYGALEAVRKYVPTGGTLILAGHSQGAAVAVLAHAFFYYALNPADGGDPFQIKDKKYLLKSYTFAQPRPGNLQFALNFARITRGGATSFALNNTIDPVTMIPTTHSFIVGAFEDSPNNQEGWKVLRMLNNKLNGLSKLWNRVLAKGLQPELGGVQSSPLSDYDFKPELWGHIEKGQPSVSQNYVTAGNQIPLVGHTKGDIMGYYGDPNDEIDEFIQHHATTYRRLLEELFHLDPTTEIYMEAQRSRDQ